MTYARRVEIMEGLFAELRELGAAKAKDYSPGEDTLANFRQGASATGLSPETYLVALCAKQFGAIATSVGSGNAPGCESLRDKIRDVMMYMVLLECLSEDGKAEPEPFVADRVYEPEEVEAARRAWMQSRGFSSSVPLEEFDVSDGWALLNQYYYPSGWPMTYGDVVGRPGHRTAGQVIRAAGVPGYAHVRFGVGRCSTLMTYERIYRDYRVVGGS